MSAPVDVLAVLKRHVALAEQVGCREQQAEAHALFDAIAELIEAANGMLDVTGRGKVCTVTESLAAYRRLESAIASATGCNCPGGASSSPASHAPNCQARAALRAVSGEAPNV